MSGGLLFFVIFISLIGIIVGAGTIYRLASEYVRLEFRVKRVNTHVHHGLYYPQVKLINSFDWVTIKVTDGGFMLEPEETVDNSRSTFKSAEDICKQYKEKLSEPDSEYSEKITEVCKD